MVDILDLGPELCHAMTGNFEPLARHIESGGRISPGMRKFLAEHLRGEFPRQPGNKRTYAQMEMESRILTQISLIQILEGVTENKALSILLDRKPDLNRDTVKGYIRKNKMRRPPRKR
jgi:hypothetical protein